MSTDGTMEATVGSHITCEKEYTCMPEVVYPDRHQQLSIQEHDTTTARSIIMTFTKLMHTSTSLAAHLIKTYATPE